MRTVTTYKLLLTILLYSTLSIFTVIPLQAQIDVNVLYQNGTMVFDATYDTQGNYYVAGTNHYYPRLIKLNPSGDVVFDKVYDLSGWWNNYSQFIKITSDSSNNIYAYGTYDNSIGGFVCKIDTAGNFVWFTDSISANSHKNAHIKTIDNRVYLINAAYKEIPGPNFRASFLQTFNEADGELLRQDTLCDWSQEPLTKCTSGGRSINSYSHLKTYSISFNGDVLSIDTNANIEVIPIENVDSDEYLTFPTLLAASSEHFYVLRYDVVGEYLDTELFQPKVVKYNTNWVKLEEAVFDYSAEYLLQNNLRQSISYCTFSEKYGLVCFGFYDVPNDPFVPTEGKFYVTQFDHRTMRPIKVEHELDGFANLENMDITEDGLVRSTHWTYGNHTGTTVLEFQLEPLWPLGVEEEVETSQSTIYPNPNVRQQLELASDLLIEQVTIYSINGNLVYSKQIARPSYSLSLSTLQSGVYIVELRLQNGKIDQHKLLKL